MKGSLMRGALEVVTCYAASRQALASNRRGQLDDETLAARLQAIEHRMATLRGAHWALDVLMNWLGRPDLLSRPVCMLLLLAGVSWLVRCQGVPG